MPAHPLSGGVGVVTGANHGIGAATAVALSRLGADIAKARLGPVSILVNNASGWRQDTFGASAADRFGRKISQ